MARIVAFIPDLLFGSNVLGALRAAGHDATLTGNLDEVGDAEVLIVDLTSDAPERIERVGVLGPDRPPTLAFYSHVEGDVRERAQAAGFELVVPRSRMAREGPALAARLAAAGS